GHGEHLLRRGYVVFDNERMQRALGAEVEMVRDTALGAEHDIEHTTLRLASGSSLQARLAIDATGSGVLLAHRAVAGIGAENVGGAQTAYGLVVGSSPHVQPEVFTLMDWRHPDAESSNAGVPGNKSGAHATVSRTISTSAPSARCIRSLSNTTYPRRSRCSPWPTTRTVSHAPRSIESSGAPSSQPSTSLRQAP
ncbi:MAG: hypothetical protein EBV17_05265, partial [Actinobacteria bacterium]|nr:hypothetical protein [Actinomycetota bacterium]